MSEEGESSSSVVVSKLHLGLRYSNPLLYTGRDVAMSYGYLRYTRMAVLCSPFMLQCVRGLGATSGRTHVG